MKKIICFCIISMMVMFKPINVFANSKDKAKISYVLKNMRLKKDAADKLEVELAAYYKEVAAAKADYKAMKDKLEMARDAGRLTAEQCDMLFEGKQKQDIAEMEVRKKYYSKFKTILTTQQAYEAIRLCNDKLN